MFLSPVIRRVGDGLVVAGIILALVAATAIAPPGSAVARSEPDGESATTPLVIAHRGASGYRPEHTLAAYELAIDMGAEVIEPDLVSTADGVLVARHENEISETTDVAERPEFAARRTTKVIDGRTVSGWFTEDFTLSELKTLRAVERLPDLRPDNTVFDGQYQVPTLQEVSDLARRRGVGIYPETKHPTYFDSIGLSVEEPLVAMLHHSGWRKRTDPVFIQSFETANLRELATMTNLRLVQLVNSGGRPFDFEAAGDDRTYADLVTRDGLAWIASYADGIGPNKNLIVPRNPDGSLRQPTTLVADAHREGLLVHPWTFRNENEFLPADFRAGDPAADGYEGATGNAPVEYRLFLGLGVDGVFADNPDTAVAARDAWSSRRRGDR